MAKRKSYGFDDETKIIIKAYFDNPTEENLIKAAEASADAEMKTMNALI